MPNRLKNTLLISGLTVALGGASAASAAMTTQDAVANDQAAPARLDNAVSYAGEAGQFEKTQFFWGGRNYCWYPGGWQGPGYYWCGYAWRRGYGWGGPIGWHGWGRPGWHDGGRWNGGRGDWHGDRGRGDWHGDGGHDRGHDDGGRGDGGHHHH
jgi:hypothetical protein